MMMKTAPLFTLLVLGIAVKQKQDVCVIFRVFIFVNKLSKVISSPKESRCRRATLAALRVLLAQLDVW